MKYHCFGLPVACIFWFVVYLLSFPNESSATIDVGTSCNSSLQFFDISALQCGDCPVNQDNIAERDDCQCSEGFLKIYDPVLITYNCSDLCMQNNQVTSKDQLKCATCDTGSGAYVNGSACNCPQGMYIAEIEDSNSVTQTCVQCTNGYYVADKYSCVACPNPLMITSSSTNWKCSCSPGYSLLGNECVDSSVVNALDSAFSDPYRVRYLDVVNGNGATQSREIQSKIFQDKYLISSGVCQQNNAREGCNAIANLCVLQQYETSTAACSMYQRLLSKQPEDAIHGYSDWRASLPWLYYSNPQQALNQKTDIQLKVAFSAEAGSQYVDKLTFYLVTYNADGSFVNIELLSDQFHKLCGVSPDSDFLKIGVEYRQDCYLSLQSLLSTTTYFYDIYVLDVDGSLKPIPVINKNLRKNGVAVNVNQNAAQSVDDVYVRRFILQDTVSGIETSSADLTPTIIRIPTSIEFHVKLQGSSGLIYPPSLVLHYVEKSVDSASHNTKEKLTFAVKFSIDESKFNKAYIGLLITFLVLAFIIAIYKLVGWMRKNNNPQANCDLLVRFVVIILSTCGDAIFWVAYIFSVYWLIFYKGQDRVSVLLPSSEAVNKIWPLVLVAGIAKIIDLIYYQCHVDVFFVDWEKGRKKEKNLQEMTSLSNQASELNNNTQTQTTGVVEMANVSAWRTLFVGNEWNERQTIRKTDINISLVILLFLLLGINLEYWASEVPSTSSRDKCAADINMVLKFGITTSFWILIGAAQVAINQLVYYRFVKDPISQFVDLLSVCNVSMFIFSERCHGYYLHGRSVHAVTETNMSGLLQNLKKEEDNLTGTRGLLPNSQIQTFEVHSTPDLRDQYEKLFVYFMLQDLEQRQQPHDQIPLIKKMIKKIPESKVLEGYTAFSKFLTGFINNTNTTHKYTVQSKPFLYRLFNYTPAMLPQSQTILYEDVTGQEFTEVLMFGNEYDLLLFDILIFSLVDMASSSSCVAALVTWIVNKLVVAAREKFGESNISEKTLIDKRFLL